MNTTMNNNLKAAMTKILMCADNNEAYVSGVVNTVGPDRYDRYGDSEEFNVFPDAIVPNLDLGECVISGSVFNYTLLNGAKITITFPEVVEAWKAEHMPLNPAEEAKHLEAMRRVRKYSKLLGISIEESKAKYYDKLMAALEG